MSFETHGFFTGGPKKIAEDIGHIVLGHLPLDLLWYGREHTTVRLPWPFKGQWPPGKAIPFPGTGQGDLFFVVALDRVSDSARDEFGRSIGAQLRPISVALITRAILT